jgi:hypothetical protein
MTYFVRANVNNPFLPSLFILKSMSIHSLRLEMENTSVLGSSLSLPTGSNSAKWYLAKGISIVFSPPLLGIVAMAILGLELGTLSSWVWIIVYAALTMLAPVAFLLHLMRRGEISDFHIRKRSERIKPLTALLLLSFLSWLIFLAGEAPYLFQVFALIGTLQAMVMLLITLRWKISGHGASAAGFSVLLWGLYGSAAALAFLFIPIVIWARVSLDRHDLSQSLAGAALGASFMLAVFVLMASHCSITGVICA